MKDYEMVIGLEVHAELATKTKIFCACPTKFGGAVNTQCCPICMGLPGTLPVLNKKVVEYAVAAGLAMNCTITRNCRFDRKNYFYPDLPKAYQISQLYLPICRNGSVEIETDGRKTTIGITEIHMEEDAGKLLHDSYEDATLVDYNRCGVPLIEIVSKPDMHSATEVVAYLEKLKEILQYLGVSDCKMQEGSLRADINLSVRKAGEKRLGTRTEMKNMNSFKAIARAVEEEGRRQAMLLESGRVVWQETRRWDDAKGISVAMRKKEDAQDYRYFPEPDLPPLEISDEWLREIQSRQPEMRKEKQERYKRDYGIPAYDAQILTSSKAMADLFEMATTLCKKPKEVSNWLMGEGMRLLREMGQEPEEMSFSPEHLASFVELVDGRVVNRTVAKEVFEQIFKEDVEPVAYVEEHGLKIIQDREILWEAARKVVSANPKSASDYQGGKKKAIGYLVGQTMKEMKGKSDPGLVKEILLEILEEL